MLAAIKTFNGFSLNSGGYESAGLEIHTPPAVSPAFIELVNTDPLIAGVFTRAARNLPVAIKLRGADRWALMQALKTALQPGTRGNLVVTMQGVDYQLECVVQSLVPDARTLSSWLAILQAGSSMWRAVSAETDSWSVDADGDTKTISVGGCAPTVLNLEITPTVAPATGWLYQRLYQVVPPVGVAFGRRPMCIVVDTAALVTAGKVQADCSDLRVYVGDSETPRWIADANTDHTHVWFNMQLGRGYKMVLKDAVASSGAVGELVFAVNANNKAALAAIPTSGLLVHGTEWFLYGGKDLKRYKLAVTQRGALGTTLQGHNAGSEFFLIEQPVYLIYGNSEATDPTTDNADYDLEKPLFNLSSSDNGSWTWDASHPFYDEANPNRPGGWQAIKSALGPDSKTYLVKQNAESGDAAIGGLIKAWIKAGKVQAENAALSWIFTTAGGISSVSMAGQKYRNTSSWPSKAALEKSLNGKTWSSLWNESSPVNSNSWTAWTRNNQSISDRSPMVRLIFSGSLSAANNAAAAMEALSATIVFYSANLPSVTLLSEVGNYPLTLTITNQTTGDALDILYPMQLNKALAISGEEHTAAVDGVNAHAAVSPDDDSRDEWIRLAPGENILEASADVMGTLSIALSWYPRQP